MFALKALSNLSTNLEYSLPYSPCPPQDLSSSSRRPLMTSSLYFLCPLEGFSLLKFKSISNRTFLLYNYSQRAPGTFGMYLVQLLPNHPHGRKLLEVRRLLSIIFYAPPPTPHQQSCIYPAFIQQMSVSRQGRQTQE